jgi:hypothetical protein
MQLYSELGKTVYSGRAKEYLIGLLMSSAKKTFSTNTKLSKNLLVSIDFPRNMVRVDRWEAVGHGQLHVARCSPDCVGAVAVVLLLGFINMMRGGSGNTSQPLMRLRVPLQFIAIIVIMLTVWIMAK